LTRNDLDNAAYTRDKAAGPEDPKDIKLIDAAVTTAGKKIYKRDRKDKKPEIPHGLLALCDID